FTVLPEPRLVPVLITTVPDLELLEILPSTVVVVWKVEASAGPWIDELEVRCPEPGGKSAKGEHPLLIGVAVARPDGHGGAVVVRVRLVQAIRIAADHPHVRGIIVGRLKKFSAPDRRRRRSGVATHVKPDVFILRGSCAAAPQREAGEEAICY